MVLLIHVFVEKKIDKKRRVGHGETAYDKLLIVIGIA